MDANETMTAERSLEIIKESIERSQRAITKNSAKPLIWWGVVTFGFSLLVAFLWKNHGGPIWNVLWFLMFVIGYAGERLFINRGTTIPVSFVGNIIGKVWTTFGIFCGLIGWIFGLIFSGVLPLKVESSVEQTLYVNVTSVIVLCLGMGSTIMGFILKSRIIQICGIIAGISGYFYALKFMGAEQLYVMAGVAVIGLVVPGVLLYSHNKN